MKRIRCSHVKPSRWAAGGEARCRKAATYFCACGEAWCQDHALTAFPETGENGALIRVCGMRRCRKRLTKDKQGRPA